MTFRGIFFYFEVLFIMMVFHDNIFKLFFLTSLAPVFFSFSTFFFKIAIPALTSVALLVGASSGTPNGHG